MAQNPEEGRLSDEAAEKLLREARLRTREMKNEYKHLRRETTAKQAAERWAANHRKKHQQAYDDLSDAASKMPLNRRQRRHFAKQMNVFKSKGGWELFSKNYRKTFNQAETVVKHNGKKTEKRTNIQQVLDAAKAEKASN